MTLRIEKLRREHGVDSFDRGKEPLNRFLIRFALQSQMANASQTYVALSGASMSGDADNAMIAYYTLVFGDVAYDDAPERLRKGVARYPIPLMVLARLAVSRDWQGRHLGSGLLKDALLRTLAAADIAGLRALAVHAKDDDARRFYEHYDFAPSPTDANHLFLMLKDIRAVLGA